jgi:O-antigen/teichoic acid export membrane protein
VGYRGREATPLVRFGGQVSVIGFLEFACLQVDSVGVARGGEPAELGQYNRASILAYPVVQVSLVATRVLLPAFARITDRARLARAYTDALVVLATASFTTAAVLAAGHQVLVLALLGTGWTATAAVLPWLAAASAVQALNQLPGALCEAQGVLRPKIWIQSAVLAVFVASAVLAVRTDAPLSGYAGCWLLAEAVRHVLYVMVVTRRLGVPLAAQGAGLAQAVLVAGATYGAVTGVGRVLSGAQLPVGPAVAAVLLTGVAVPLGLLACWPGSRLRSVVRDRRLLAVLPDSGRTRRLGRRVLG